MMEAEVLKLFSARRAMGPRSKRMLRGACYALADWITRNLEYLKYDDMIELTAIGGTMLEHTGSRTAIRRDGRKSASRRSRTRLRSSR